MIDVIVGGGYDSAALMIVGDYARKADEVSGRCLSGYYEKTVDRLLKDNAYGIDRCYLTCLFKRYVVGLGAVNYKVDRKKLETFNEEHGVSDGYWLELLVKEINEIKPCVIVVMGEYALRALTGKEGIGKWRGSALPLLPEVQHYVERKDIKVIPTLHVAEIHTDESNTHLIRWDLKKAIDLVYKPDKPLDAHEITICRSSGDLIKFRQQFPDDPDEMVTDIETRFGIITCASISFDGYRAATIPLFGAPGIDIIERARMMYLLALDLQNTKIDKCNQNIGYDQRIYQRFGMPVTNIVWDTMLAASSIATEFPKRLGFLTSIYTDMSYYKDDGRQLDSQIFNFDTYYKYCAKDSISTFQIWQKQKEDLKELGMYEFFTQFIMPLYHLYFRVESIGWKVDLKKRDELLAKYAAFYTMKYLELQAIIGYKINMDSPKQIGDFMEKNHFPVIRHRTPSGNMAVSTGLNELKKMRGYDEKQYDKTTIPYSHCIRFIDLVLLLRRIDKVIEYVEVGIHPWGRVHTNTNLAGTGNGRTSGSQTADQMPIWAIDKKTDKEIIKWKNLGQSFQTITKHGFIIEGEEDIDDVGNTIGKDIREMYVPDRDYIIIEADGGQAEARVVDVLAEDWDGLAEYGKIDKHCKVASLIYTDYTYEDIVRLSKKEKTDEGLYMRFIGKKGKHANNLGVGEYVLSLTANITVTEARKILTKLAHAYPNTKEIFHKQVEELLRSERKLFNPFGRARLWFKQINGHYIKAAYSWLPQSIVSDNTKRAILYADSHPLFDRDKMWFLAENHDSVTALVKRSYARRYMSIIKEALELPIDMRKCSLPRDIQLVIPAEFSIGRRNWGTIKEIKKFKNLASFVSGAGKIPQYLN
jgi:uracil-DNA glycosylase family 4